MRLVDASFTRPSLFLAFDEALLESVEAGRTDDTLWFWESPAPFVVLGVSQAVAKEVREAECAQAGIPILRRCSAGGCVLQGPGCLNFTLALTHERHPEIKTIRGSYCYILGRICAALRRRGVAASHMGISDLAIGDRKFSGNAQRRRKRGLLHHGSVLYHFDLPSIAKYLREPEDRPDYRGARNHLDFVQNVPLSCAQLQEALGEAFGVSGQTQPPFEEELRRAELLASEKYESLDWIRRR